MDTVSAFAHFPARTYLEKYYSYVGDENQAMMRALARFAQRFEPPLERVVEVGGGPSVVPVLALCAATGRSPGSITFADIAPANLAEVELWLARQPEGFDYRDVLAWLSDEHAIEVAQVERLARESEWRLSIVDLHEHPSPSVANTFDTISSHFFAESATSDEQELILLLGRIAELAAPNATVLLSFMRRSLGYTVDGIDFPAVPVDEDSLPDLLAAAGLDLVDAELMTIGAETPPTRPGYEGMVFVGGVVRC